MHTPYSTIKQPNPPEITIPLRLQFIKHSPHSNAWYDIVEAVGLDNKNLNINKVTLKAYQNFKLDFPIKKLIVKNL